MLKWYRRYKFLKSLGVNRPFKASLDKRFCGGVL